MARLSNEKIAEIQQLYSEIGIYSQVAKKVGCSPSTVKKYCTMAAVEQQVNKLEFNSDIPSIDTINLTFFLENNQYLTTLTNDEQKEMKELWNEL